MISQQILLIPHREKIFQIEVCIAFNCMNVIVKRDPAELDKPSESFYILLNFV